MGVLCSFFQVLLALYYSSPLTTKFIPCRFSDLAVIKTLILPSVIIVPAFLNVILNFLNKVMSSVQLDKFGNPIKDLAAHKATLKAELVQLEEAKK